MFDFVPPSLLKGSARLLELLPAPTALVLRAIAGAPVPFLGAEHLASARPRPLEALPEASPFVVTFEPGDALPGPLGGAHVVVKDSIDVAGAPTGIGLLDGGDLALEDARLVARVRAAGGLIVGKTRMPELGMDGLGHPTPGAPMPTNPRAPGHCPGGSSTGTAVAVAAGLARFGVAGDGLGSARIPAAFCGLVGLKPTMGRLPIEGYRTPAPSMDVPGSIARTVEDCAQLFHVMAGEPPATIVARTPSRVGTLRGLGPELASRSIAGAFARALGAVETDLEPVDVPHLKSASILAMAIATSEVARSAYADRRVSPAGRVTIALGRSLGEDDVAHLERIRETLRDGIRRALDRVGILAMPTTAIPAPPVSRALVRGGQDTPLLRAIALYTPIANLTGHPAIAVPCGVDARGRPLSIMLMGREGAEAELFEMALAIERAGLAEVPIELG